MASSKRSDEDYEIEALTRGLQVLEALEGIRWEPVDIATVMERTGFSYDFCMRALRTLRLKGYAESERTKWTAGRRLIRIAASVSRHKV